MGTKMWSPFFWRTFYMMTITYPENPTEQDKQETKEWFELTTKKLPCPDCRREFTQLMKQYPIDSYLDSPKHLQQWLWNQHKRVNERVGSPMFPLDQLNSYLTSFHCDFSRKEDVNFWIMVAFLVFFLVLSIVLGALLMYFLLKKSK